MAHFAELDETNTVIRVVVVANSDIMDGDVESESLGQTFLEALLPGSGPWVQTSYNHKFRGRFASQEFIYHPNDDVFAPPSEYPSWVLNTTHGTWHAPIPIPDDVSTGPDDKKGKMYQWDEDTISWIEMTE